METYSLPEKFIGFARQFCPEFTVDKENRTVVENLYGYFTLSPGCPLDLQKGIWLEGGLGTGKSTLLYVFSKLMIHLRQGFIIQSCPDIAVSYAGGDNLDRYTFCRNSYPARPVNMGFDELMREQIPAYQYKNALNVMQYILHTRYSLWQRQRIQTYITTNGDAEEVERLYGDFIRSRRQEMFNIVPLTGKDRRKQAN